ncbi:Trafficking protein particle complex subunit 12 [Boothiomyces macroporosus]|uniref:Trafficking protein particle complex subunit 12 n=1 Tax=Boothiomyces macroporosus TaxID=261099 RepID=A0AAD5UMX3_9FUNG|nr:Trafficking protein particle complex subunit 12 [Boothiomyces macroporosus]
MEGENKVRKALDIGDLLDSENSSPKAATPKREDSKDALWGPDISLEGKEEENPFQIQEQQVQIPQETKPVFENMALENSLDIDNEPDQLARLPTIQLPLNISPVKTENLSAASSIKSSIPKSRLVPTPAVIDPIHYKLPTRRWIDPVNFSDIPALDPLNDTITKIFGNVHSSQRPNRIKMSLEQALEYEDPYDPLIKSFNWRQVALLARNDLISTHPADVKDIMHLWYVRWSAMIKLKLYDLIQSEIDKLKANELQEMMYELYPDIFPDQSGQMVSFEVLCLIAHLPSLKGNHHESIHRIYKLMYPQRPWDFIPDNTQHYQLVLYVVCLLIQISDLVLAASVLNELLQEHESDPHMWSMLGRLYLQAGDLETAKEIFFKVESMLGLPQSTEFQKLPEYPQPELILSQRGFYYFAIGDYNEALNQFTQLLTTCPEYDSAKNNVAICQLYAGNVSQASR